jgi:hypothetical protein
MNEKVKSLLLELQRMDLTHDILVNGYRVNLKSICPNFKKLENLN